MSDRWENFTHEEQMDIHTALRVLLTHPLFRDEEEKQRTKGLADEIWNRHAKQVEEAHR